MRVREIFAVRVNKTSIPLLAADTSSLMCSTKESLTVM